MREKAPRKPWIVRRTLYGHSAGPGWEIVARIARPGVDIRDREHQGDAYADNQVSDETVDRAASARSIASDMSAAVAQMDLASYRQLVRSLPAPTASQREAFSFYVSEAHSWYKHIPVLGRGVPFLLYLDPGAGCDRVRRPRGGWASAPRAQQGFHHNAIRTDEYRERFGHLVFANGEALQAGRFADGSLRIETGFGSSVIDDAGALRRLPVEVEATAVWLTSIIHPYANQDFIWQILAGADLSQTGMRSVWPEQSGGWARFTRIHARCRELEEDYSRVVELPYSENRGVDAVFADLVEPERQRQRKLMVTAIERLLTLVDLPLAH